MVGCIAVEHPRALYTVKLTIRQIRQLAMTDDNRDSTTTGIMENLFDTLRSYSQGRKVTDEELLRQRARQYADTLPQKAQVTGETLQAITFIVGDEQYGLDVGVVRSVRPLPKITRVPNAPPYFIGVVNVRGAVVTLLDLRILFGIGRTDNAEEMIVIQNNDLTLAIPVKRVQDVLTIPRAQVTGLEDVRYALGAYVNVNERIIVIHADELFGDQRLIEANES